MKKYTIWFIDEEETQRIIFESAFEDDFNVKIIETETIDSPDKLLDSALAEKVDILLIDYDMFDVLWYWWKELEHELNKLNPHFPFMIVTSQIKDAFDHIENPSVVYSKEVWDWENDTSLQNFKIKLEKIIEKYKKDILESEIELKNLLDKMDKTDLTPEEEDRYVKLNKFISEIHSDPTWSSFFSWCTNSKLDSIIEKTEELLGKLWKNE